MSERREIHECRVTVSRLQRQGKVDGHSGGTASAFCVHDRKYFTARTLFLDAALGCGEANKCLEKIGGGGGTLDKLAGSRAHGIHDDLRLIQISDGEHSRIWQFLMQKF